MSPGQGHPARELRERIIDAALQVIRENGMTRARTSAIAEAAGCAEGSIYRYFSGKPELLEEVVRTRLPTLPSSLDDSRLDAGRATVRANLVDVARGVVAFYTDAMPLAAGVLADAELDVQRRLVHDEAGFGAGAADALAVYLRAEQELGRVRADADAEAAARLLIASCLGESVLRALSGRDAASTRDWVAAEGVEVLLAGLDPDATRPAGPVTAGRRES